MGFKGILYFFILFVAIISFLSYKKGIYLIWISLLFIPTIILESTIKMNLPMETILMAGSVCSELRYKKRRHIWSKFLMRNQVALFFFFFVSFSIVFFSQTVPLQTQLRLLFQESVMLLFGIQTFLLVINERETGTFLKWTVCIAIIYNVVWCIGFEWVLGFNPAGMPLYILMGVDDNEFIADMSNVVRGDMTFRAQTVYRHPLSLGQYMLVLLPFFLAKGKMILNFIFISLICFLIVMTGSRSALFPVALIFFLYLINGVKVHLKKFVILICVFLIATRFIPEDKKNEIAESVEPFVASLYFWDDDKQSDNAIKGSTMEMRIDQFSSALKEIYDNPIFGRGYGYRDYYIYKHNALHPHLLGFESVLLLYLVERGWVGLVFFFIMSYYVYKIFMKNTNDRRGIRFVFIGFILSVIMTGVRPLTILFVCLSCSLLCGALPAQGIKELRK